jgi:hypothetical protein
MEVLREEPIPWVLEREGGAMVFDEPRLGDVWLQEGPILVPWIYAGRNRVTTCAHPVGVVIVPACEIAPDVVAHWRLPWDR